MRPRTTSTSATPKPPTRATASSPRPAKRACRNGVCPMRLGPWYGDGEESHHSCRHLRECVTEFGAQGLELDGVLLAWGTDLVVSPIGRFVAGRPPRDLDEAPAGVDAVTDLGGAGRRADAIVGPGLEACLDVGMAAGGQQHDVRRAVQVIVTHQTAQF